MTDRLQMSPLDRLARRSAPWFLIVAFVAAFATVWTIPAQAQKRGGAFHAIINGRNPFLFLQRAAL
jgi:hypothetical protein